MKSIIFLCCVLLLSACGNSEHYKIMIDDSGKAVGRTTGRATDNEGGLTEEEVVITFFDVYTEVFEQNCIACHGDYSEYGNVAADIEGIMREVLSERMPKFGPPLNLNQKELLEDWVALGLPAE